MNKNIIFRPFIFAICFVISCLYAASPVEARIRMRKVKDAPKTCAYMKEDELLSREDKTIWATERNSVVIADEVTLVNDLGQKFCQWDKASFASFGDISNFRFYIDEFKEFVYPYLDKKNGEYVVFKIPFKTCSLENLKTVAQLEFPKCEKPKKNSKKRKNKKA